MKAAFRTYHDPQEGMWVQSKQPNYGKSYEHSPTLLAFLLALGGLPTKADTSFTTTGWLRAAPLAGITVSNHSGQV
jgi:hypothetical protein